MGLSRLLPLALVLVAVLLGIVLVEPYRAVTVEFDDGRTLSVVNPERLNHTSDVWDYLQLGRRLFEGYGFSSRFTYVPFLPESAAYLEEHDAFPLLWRQPGYPALLALGYRLAGGPDPNVLLALQLLWVILLPLATLYLARALLPPGGAALAAGLALASPLVLGVREPLVATTFFACWTALLFGTALRVRGPMGVIGLGLLIGVGALFRQETWLLVPALFTVWWVRGERGRVSGVAIAAVTVLLVLLPWMVRTAQITGHPFYNAASLIYHDTPSFPGWAASRTLAIRETTPLAFILAHPLDILAKSALNLLRFGRDLLLLPGPAAALFAWWFLIRPQSTQPRVRAYRWGYLVALAVPVLVLAPMEYAPRFLAPMVPLGATAAAFALSRIPGRSRLLTVVVLVVSLVVLVSAIRNRPVRGTAPEAIRDLQELVLQVGPRALEPDQVVVSDAPTLFAYLWDRPAVWAPVPLSMPAVRELVPVRLGLLTCTGGIYDGLPPELLGRYAAYGRVTPHGCRAWVDFADPPAEATTP